MVFKRKNIFPLCILMIVAFFSQSCMTVKNTGKTESSTETQEEEKALVKKEDPVIFRFSATRRDEMGERKTSQIPQTTQGVNGNREYQVKAGDTLMLVAFRLYGDYSRWREIYSRNSGKIAENYEIEAGMTLQVQRPERPYRAPKGKPYFIKRGDSLSRISQKVYGKMKKWPRIYKNNPRQIKDPDLIFAGFMLYYPSQEKSTHRLY